MKKRKIVHTIHIIHQIVILTHAVVLLRTVSLITVLSIFTRYGTGASSCSNTLISRANTWCTTAPTGPTGPPAVHFRATKKEKKETE